MLQKNIQKYLPLLFALAPLFLFLISAEVMADDHSWGRSRGSGGPMSDADAFIAAGVLAGVFGVCLFAAFFIHGWIIALALRLPMLFSFPAVLSKIAFLAGELPVVIAQFLAALIMIDSMGHTISSSELNKLLIFLLILFLCSIIYHYLLLIILGALSKRNWHKHFLFAYTATAFLAAIASLVVSNPTPLVVVLLTGLIPYYLGWQIYTRRIQKIATDKNKESQAA